MKMSLPIRVALISAGAAFLFTILAGILFQIPWLSLLQRVAVSVSFFSIVGYLVGIGLEKSLRAMLSKKPIGPIIDTVNEQDRTDLGNFDPFTPNSFEHINRK